MKVFMFVFLLFFFSCSQDLLPIGSQAPDFSLQNESGEFVTLSDVIKRSSVILIFYPGDNTPVCKKQLCEMRDNYEVLQEEGYEVLGINDGDIVSHKSFIEKNSYQFPLLVDTDKSVAAQYNCKTKLGIKRTVYVIGKDGLIKFSQRGKPKSGEILEALGEN